MALGFAMDSEELVIEQKEVGAEFVRRMDEKFHLSAALWARSNETGR